MVSCHNAMNFVSRTTPPSAATYRIKIQLQMLLQDTQKNGRKGTKFKQIQAALLSSAYSEMKDYYPCLCERDSMVF